jgi:GntR family transcriptional regulator/MocR family aminotransferase
MALSTGTAEDPVPTSSTGPVGVSLEYDSFMAATLPLVLDRSARMPASAQIAAGVRTLVAAGSLQPQQAVPSTRALAASLSVSRGTVVAAYDQLISEGYLVSRPGGTTRVHPDAGELSLPQGADTHAASLPRAAAVSAPAAPLIDLSPHRRTAPRMDDPAWREAWRRAATAPEPSDRRTSPQHPGEDFWAAGSSPAQGLPELREAVTEHLRLMRAMSVDPAQLVITAGARDGLALLIAALRDTLAPMAVEDPGYPGLRRVLRRLMVPTLPAPTDSAGAVPSLTPAAAGSVLLTPNHLFPTGSGMPAPRRIELLRQAADRGQLVIEDDFDSDYRHVGAPLPTLWDLAPESVVHLGTFTQVLTPEAAVGYILAPPALVPALAQARSDLGSGASAIAQRAVADYLASGGLRRSITRRRRALVRRRARLLETLADWEVEMVSGAQAVVRLGNAGTAHSVAEACLAHGVRVGDLGGYWEAGGQRSAADANDVRPEDAHGVMLSFNDVSDDALTAALRIVARSLRENRG